MTWQVGIMFTVAGLFTLIGIAMLVSLAWPTAPARVYVFRMVGIMLVAAGFVLGLSADAMWSWGPGR
ncbi:MULTISPECIES: hypothetical protein [unclassified Sphingomonas]|uniref:hypothetical protein n=1 Tax=unclassified Sphingomonas TaxID=196159 RepID=UPI001F59252D|nr:MULTISPECIES: hypothetical protein [unclassified Sphingomonas]